MSGGLATLLLFSAAMAVASFAAGMLPLAITLSQRQLRLISTLGMGILVGTSLIVIIPEGVDALYSAQPAGKHVDRRATDSLIPGVFTGAKMAVDGVVPDWEGIYTRRGADEHNDKKESDQKGHKDDHDDDNHEHGKEAHSYVGLALVSGFVLMFLIDRLPAHFSSSNRKTYHVALDNLGGSSHDDEDEPEGSSHAAHKPTAMTAGLVIHAAADGIALGASSTSSNLGLKAVIFLAIMVHKAPAAFGLTAVLLKTGLSSRQIRKHLGIFSLAAPAGALVTWAILTLLGGEAGTSMDWWTGLLLLFSGGTFLYVAVHAMQNNHEDNSRGDDSPLLNTGIAVLGMVIPFLTQLGHHAH